MSQEKYNINLRSQILVASIRVEEAAGKALKLFLRTVKKDSKTLSNKSSSLSFKNKIDILYDIEDINKENYNRYLKFAEIRNQFIHNPNCNSFLALEKENNNLLSFLSKNFPNEIEDKEENYSKNFFDLWKNVLGSLLILKMKYEKGASKEFIRYVDSEAVKRFNIIYQSAVKDWRKNNPEPNRYESITDDFFTDFKRTLNLHLIEERIKIIDSIEADGITEKDIFDRRLDFAEEFKKLKEKN